jgi:hypothetical protein
VPQPPKKPHTHTAWAYKRIGKKHGRVYDCGTGRIDRDRDIAHVYMDRTPIGGWTGYVVLLPHGTAPAPQQHDHEASDETQEEESEDAAD